jgi:hypothetical protein
MQLSGGSRGWQRVAIVALVLGLALVHDRGAQAAKPAKPVTCVKATSEFAYAPEKALAVVRAALAPQTLTNQSGTVHLTPGHYFVDQVTWLGPEVKSSPWKRDFDRVRNACGRLQAERSWRVMITLSEAQLVLPPVVFVATPTRTGWKIVYRS